MAEDTKKKGQTNPDGTPVQDGSNGSQGGQNRPQDGSQDGSRVA